MQLKSVKLSLRFILPLAAVLVLFGYLIIPSMENAPDDFGKPETAFNICTFWRIDALARIGRRDEARAVFEAMLAARNHLGLLSEDTHPVTGEMWGNFPQTYSMVGLINCAVRLSIPWNKVV